MCLCSWIRSRALPWRSARSVSRPASHRRPRAIRRPSLPNYRDFLSGQDPDRTGAPFTGIFTVLVDGDDHNEPIADAVRGILDGHIVMERTIAERGRYPAINILKSISRTMPRAADPQYLPVLTRARQVMATYADMEELIRLGAYRAGTSAEVDEAIRPA